MTNDPTDGTDQRGTVAHPHDAVFRRMFGQPEHAASELRSILPSALTERLALDKLVAVEGTFVDNGLEKQQCDVLFRTRFNQRTAYVYVLLEHQRTSNPWMALRMLRYVLRIWERHRDLHPHATRLPLVLPIVVYQGQRRWTATLDLADLLDLDPDDTMTEALRPRFRYTLDDLSTLDETDLQARPLTAAARLTLFVMRAAPGSTDITPALSRWITLLKDLVGSPTGIEDLAALLAYIQAVGETPNQTLREFIRTLGPKAEEAYVTTADMLRAEGRAEGEAKGRTEGRAATLLQLLTMKFGALDDATQQRIRRGTAVEQETWTSRVLTASTLDDMFA